MKKDNNCLCIKCGKLTISKSWCGDCRKKYNREYHQKNRDEVLKRKRKYDREKSKDPKYKEKHNKSSRDWYNRNKEKVVKRNREYLDRARGIVIEHYGGECVCCKENTKEFLAIDHINENGAEHRRKIKRKGKQFCVWIIKNNFPKDLQLLCHNCNYASYFYRICPHKSKKKK